MPDDFLLTGRRFGLLLVTAPAVRKRRGQLGHWCFSRCLAALRRAIKLFIWAYNQRQLWQQQFPQYPKHVIDFGLFGTCRECF